MPRFAVAWFPTFTGIQRIESFRAQHDPQSARIPAHVSLVFPFGTVLSALQVETHVRRVASSWPPFPVSFRAVRRHANEFVFLMAARGSESLIALHDKLYTRSLRGHLRQEFAYEPHITIARNADPDGVEKSFEAARSAFHEEFTDTVRELELLAVGADGRIETLRTIDLDAS